VRLFIEVDVDHSSVLGICSALYIPYKVESSGFTIRAQLSELKSVIRHTARNCFNTHISQLSCFVEFLAL